MAFTGYDPFALLTDVQREVNRLFNDRTAEDGGADSSRVITGAWTPAVDIKEEAERFVVLADLPGVDPKDIEITTDQNVLSIKGERRLEGEGSAEKFRRVERPRGSFYRRFSLPDTADVEGIRASGRNGVLEIEIPKQQKLQPRRIAVQG